MATDRKKWMSGRTRKILFILILVLIPLLEDVGRAGGTAVRVVMAALEIISVILLLYFAITSVIYDVRKKEGRE